MSGIDWHRHGPLKERSNIVYSMNWLKRVHALICSDPLMASDTVLQGVCCDSHYHVHMPYLRVPQRSMDPQMHSVMDDCEFTSLRSPASTGILVQNPRNS